MEECREEGDLGNNCALSTLPCFCTYITLLCRSTFSLLLISTFLLFPAVFPCLLPPLLLLSLLLLYEQQVVDAATNLHTREIVAKLEAEGERLRKQVRDANAKLHHATVRTLHDLCFVPLCLCAVLCLCASARLYYTSVPLYYTSVHDVVLCTIQSTLLTSAPAFPSSYHPILLIPYPYSPIPLFPCKGHQPGPCSQVRQGLRHFGHGRLWCSIISDQGRSNARSRL
jgi:hypothetical protein